MSRRVSLTFAIIPVVLTGLFGLTAARSADETKPDATKAAEGIDYAKWTALTEKPVVVSEYLFTSCSVATPKQIKDLKELHGPHFVGAIKMFANAEAEKALKDDPKAILPVGGTIVKEKLSKSGEKQKLLAYGAMIKREKGYDADHGDWEYVYADLSGATPKIERGMIKTCIQCHQIAKERDYLFRTYLGKSDKK